MLQPNEALIQEEEKWQTSIMFKSKKEMFYINLINILLIKNLDNTKAKIRLTFYYSNIN